LRSLSVSALPVKVASGYDEAAKFKKVMNSTSASPLRMWEMYSER
jgi:hypothetical protein